MPGLSGIGAAVHLQRNCAGKRYVILEGRPSHGRHLGPLPLSRHPLRQRHAHAGLLASSPGARPRRSPTVRRSSTTCKQTAARARRRSTHPLSATARRAPSWSSDDATWTVEAAAHGHRRDRPLHLQLPPDVRGLLQLPPGPHARVRGHGTLPRHDRASPAVARGPRLPWQDGRRHRLRRDGDDAGAGDGEGRRPRRHAAAIADVRRVAARPRRDRERAARRSCPRRWAYAITRWKNVALQQFLYRRTRTAPAKVKQKLLDLVRKELGPDYDVETHFTPRYNPWDQRLCLVPNSDLFVAIRSGQGRRSSPIGSSASPRPASRSRRASSSRPTSS